MVTGSVEQRTKVDKTKRDDLMEDDGDSDSTIDIYDVDFDENDYLDARRDVESVPIDALLEDYLKETIAPVPETEKHISTWVTEHPEGFREPLRIGESYTLNFMVGEAVRESIISGLETVVSSSDIPESGLLTEWVVISSHVELAPGTPNTSVTFSEGLSKVWTGQFSLHIPKAGDSTISQLKITPLSANAAHLDVVIYVKREIYRRFAVDLAVAEATGKPVPVGAQVATIIHDLVQAPAAHSDLRPTHEWTTPPGKLSIIVMEHLAKVIGDGRTQYVDLDEKWHGVKANVAGPIQNVYNSAKKLRHQWGDYLDDIDPGDLQEKLQKWRPEYDWANLDDYANAAHQTNWDEVRMSVELRDLAFDGHSLYEAFFPSGSEMRNVIDALTPGHRLDVSWLPTSGSGWIAHVPWGLMYLLDVPDPGKPIDPMGFLSLRLRIGYTAHPIQIKSKALGRLEDTYAGHLLYWGADPNDMTGAESRRQARQWATWRNQIIVPGTSGVADAKNDAVKLLDNPHPSPMAVLYMFCKCTVGEGNDPVLQFGETSKAADVITRTELGSKYLVDQPLVFANACTTLASEPSMANELERSFFSRGCRAYLGTESKVPIVFASCFAEIFFNFFYRQMDSAPMAAGEAVAQTRLFLWTNYRNIGGILYTYINQYELFMADDSEILALRS